MIMYCITFVDRDRIVARRGPVGGRLSQQAPCGRHSRGDRTCTASCYCLLVADREYNMMQRPAEGTACSTGKPGQVRPD